MSFKGCLVKFVFTVLFYFKVMFNDFIQILYTLDKRRVMRRLIYICRSAMFAYVILWDAVHG